MIIGPSSHDRQNLSAVRVADERRASIRPQIGAHVLNHRTQIAPIFFRDVYAVDMTKH